MQSLGETLREVREARGFSLEDIEKALRIKALYIEAIEAGDFSVLPSLAQSRGFLRNYAQYLGLDAGQILARYDELARRRGGLTRILRRRAKSHPKGRSASSPPPIPRRRRLHWISPDLFIGGLITLALLAVFVWGGTRLADTLSASGNATATVSSFFLPTLTPTRPPAEAQTEQVTATPLPPLASYTDVQIQVLVEQRSYLRVSVDGVEIFTRMVAPGESLDFVGSEVVEITTGNGAGIHVFFNQRDQGVLGRFGEVVIRLWTLDGAMTPTPTVTFTPTETAEPTRTSRP